MVSRSDGERCTYKHTCTSIYIHTNTHIHTHILAQASSASDLIPSTARVDVAIATDKDACTCNLVLTTNHDEAVIRGVVLFGEKIFEEESLFFYPQVLIALKVEAVEHLTTNFVRTFVHVLWGGSAKRKGKESLTRSMGWL